MIFDDGVAIAVAKSRFNEARVFTRRPILVTDLKSSFANLGKKQCEAIAAGVKKPNTEVEGVVKPRNIRVTHEVLYDQLAEYFTEPPKVGGLFPAPMAIGNPEIPAALDIRFDC